MKKSYLPPAHPADRDEWVELLGATPAAATLEWVGLSAQLWQAIEAGKAPPVPVACHRLASFRRYGALDALLGPEWREFEIRGRALAFPGLKYPLDVGELRQTWWRLQELGRLRAEVALLRQDAQKENAAREAAEARAEYYRGLLALEARTGAMLLRVAAR